MDITKDQVKSASLNDDESKLVELGEVSSVTRGSVWGFNFDPGGGRRFGP